MVWIKQESKAKERAREEEEKEDIRSQPTIAGRFFLNTLLFIATYLCKLDNGGDGRYCFVTAGEQ